VRVLAIDAASVSGWAVDRPGGGNDPLTGTFKLPTGSIGKQLLAYARWVSDMISAHEPDVVYCEAPLVKIDGGVMLLMGLYTHTATVAERLGVRFEKGHIQTVRRHFVGNGFAKKGEVVERCRLLGWRVADHNAADAAAIWCYAKAKHDPGFQIQTAGGGALFANRGVA
jgi:Holliday junction resolvasome RuvABC endonuclease subunit